MRQTARLIEKVRLDALTDGVFAVAMTLLVIDLKLPESFHPANAEEFLHGLLDRRVGLIAVVVVSLMVFAFSLVQPKHAMWIYLLNLLAPALRRWWPKRPDSHDGQT